MNFDTNAVEDVTMNTPRDDSRVTAQVIQLKDIKFSGTVDLLVNDVIVLEDFNSRKIFDEEKLRSLGIDIENKGLLQPVILVKIPTELQSLYDNKEVALIAGERRFRAIRDFTDLRKIPDAKVYESAAWAHRRSIMLSENSQRDDLKLLEVVDSVKVTLKEEFSSFEHPQKAFIKSEILNPTQARPVVAICQAIDINPDFYEFLENSQVQNFTAAHNLANAIIATNTGKMDKRQRDSLFEMVKQLKNDELAVTNFGKAAKSISEWSKGKAKKPKFEPKNPPVKVASGNEGDASTSTENITSTQPTKPPKPKLMKAREFEAFRDKLLKVENGELALSDQDNATIEQIRALLLGIVNV